MHYTFKKNILTLYRSKGCEWLTSLPIFLEERAREWNLSNLTPFELLSFNYVVSGLQQEKPIVLKIGFDSERLHQETEALKVFAGYGGVPILATHPHALLLEHVKPGHSLKTYVPTQREEACLIGCKVMQKLHQAPFPKNNPFPHIKEVLKILDESWNMPFDYLIAARHLKDSLIETTQEFRLLHGDLHHENILSYGKEWVVIDPHGVIGPSISECWGFIIDPLQDTRLIAKYFKYPHKTVLEWYFLRLVLATVWNLQDRLDPTKFLNLLAKTFSLIQQ